MIDSNGPEELAERYGIGDEYREIEARAGTDAARALAFLAMLHTDKGGERAASVPDPDAARVLLRRHLELPDDKLRALADGYVAEAGAHMDRLDAHETATLTALDFDPDGEEGPGPVGS